VGSGSDHRLKFVTKVRNYLLGLAPRFCLRGQAVVESPNGACTIAFRAATLEAIKRSDVASLEQFLKD
jgi:hypothetical protein